MGDQYPLYRKVGRFEPRELLGRGGFADVFLAHDPETGNEVALKTLPLSGRPDSSEIRRAEETGAYIQQQLHSVAPQVAEVYEYGKDGAYFYIAMEYIAGQDLARVLAEGPLTEGRALGIARQLCGMLEQCHGFRTEADGRTIDGIVHGDLKPGNVRLMDGDQVRVFDFGIAKFLSTTRRFTQSRGHSIPYASPERLERGIIDRRADLWSVGVILYEMVSGRHPFRARNDFDLEKAIVDGSPDPLPGECCSPALRQLIRRALAYNPDHRFASASELMTALDQVSDGGPPSGKHPAGEAPSAELPELPAATDDLTRRTIEPGDSRTRRSISIDEAKTRRTEPADLPLRATEPEADAERWDTTFLTGTGSEDANWDADWSDAEACETSDETPPPDAWSRLWQGLATSGLAGPGLIRRAGCVVVGITLGVLPVSQALVYAQARQFRQDLALSNPDEVDTFSRRYRNLDRFALLGLPVAPARQPLREALLTSANRVIVGYEVDLPQPDLAWRAAAERLRDALSLGADADGIRARMYYCKGHVDRIGAKDLEGRQEAEESSRRRNEALVNFKEAARLDPDWYAPYLGMARIYAYDEFDLDKLKDALQTAKNLGYHLGKRETAQLADGHHSQCRKLRRQTEADPDRRERRRLLSQARSHCRDSIRLYRGILDFASAKENMAWVQKTLDKVEDQLRYRSYRASMRGSHRGFASGAHGRAPAGSSPEKGA